MIEKIDVIVLGLGAMGSSAAFHLSRRGLRVLGLERFTPPHEWGSSHGQTRVIRAAYYENPLYVPLVKRAYELWAELEATSGRQLLLETGALMFGLPEAELIQGALESARIHHLDHEIIPIAEVRRRFPILEPTDEMTAVWDPRAGVLFPEACVETHLELALRNGAVLRYEEPVTAWEADGSGVRVTTPKGTYRSDRLLITAGAWLGRLIPDLSLPLTIERQVLYWFEPATQRDAFHPDRCPVYVWEYAPDRHFYGFPYLGEGVKVALHHQGKTTDPDSVEREVGADEVKSMRALLDRYMPAANGTLLSTAVCLYTNTPDLHFLIDFHPRFSQVLIGSPCSGHGFKFSSVIGDLLADLLTTGQTSFDLSLFGLERLTGSTA